MLEKLPIPVVKGVVPGKHTTRKGWLTKDFHYPQSPYTCDVNAPIWTTQFDEKKSLRQMAAEVAWFFRRSIRKYSDPFSFRLLFAIMSGRAPSMLELVDRPSAYEDVGHLCRWGMVIHELKNYDAEMGLLRSGRDVWDGVSIDEYVTHREKARQQHLTEMGSVRAVEPRERAVHDKMVAKAQNTSLLIDPEARPVIAKRKLSRRRSDTPGKLVPPRAGQYVDRRGLSLVPPKTTKERRKKTERRKNNFAVPFPDRRLTRSAYEQVFLKLVSGGRLRMGKDLYTPVGMKGWYHAVFRRESDGAERLMSIDQLLKKMNDWT
jgi:hypothetical protein